MKRVNNASHRWTLVLLRLNPRQTAERLHCLSLLVGWNRVLNPSPKINVTEHWVPWAFRSEINYFERWRSNQSVATAPASSLPHSTPLTRDRRRLAAAIVRQCECWSLKDVQHCRKMGMRNLPKNWSAQSFRKMEVHNLPKTWCVTHFVSLNIASTMKPVNNDSHLCTLLLLRLNPRQTAERLHCLYCLHCLSLLVGWHRVLNTSPKMNVTEHWVSRAFRPEIRTFERWRSNQSVVTAPASSLPHSAPSTRDRRRLTAAIVR